MDFIKWLQKELDQRDWSQNELARRAGLTSAGVSFVMTGVRQPGVEFCQGLARALRIPETVVFEEAGLLNPPRSGTEVTLRELYELMRDLPIEEQRAILDEARERWESVHGTRPAPSPSQ